MEVILAFLIMPVFGLIGATLAFAGNDMRRAAGSTRLLALAGRVVVGAIILGLLALFWISRSSLGELHVVMRFAGFLMVLSTMTVFRRAPGPLLSGLAFGGIALYLGSMALKAFDDGGWPGLGHAAKWGVLIVGAGFALGCLPRFFDKRRERRAAGANARATVF